jgi:cyclase
VVASGGMGSFADFESVVKSAGAYAVAAAHVLHYEELSISEIKRDALECGIEVRPVDARLSL